MVQLFQPGETQRKGGETLLDALKDEERIDFRVDLPPEPSLDTGGDDERDEAGLRW